MTRRVRAALLAVTVAAGCSPTVLLGTLTTDGGAPPDLAGDMLVCTICDMAFTPTDLGGGATDLGDGFPVLDSGPGPDL